MDDPKFFHVETQRTDGQWHVFTDHPIEGEEQAKVHLMLVQDFARQIDVDPNRARLRETTLQELDQMVVLSPEERDAIVTESIKSLAPGEFWKKVREARERNLAACEDASPTASPLVRGSGSP
jgi:hypothetical protein